jgi:hypothetical protein
MILPSWLKRVAIFVVVPAVGGLGLFGLVALSTATPQGGSSGWPITYRSPVSPCSAPQPFNGCGFNYNLGPVLVDYLLWVGLILAIVLIAASIRNRLRAVRRPAVQG